MKHKHEDCSKYYASRYTNIILEIRPWVGNKNIFHIKIITYVPFQLIRTIQNGWFHSNRIPVCQELQKRRPHHRSTPEIRAIYNKCKFNYTLMLV